MYVGFCMFLCVNANMAQLGGCSKSRRISRIRGATLGTYPITREGG